MATVWALCKRNLVEFVRNRTRLIFTLVFPFFFLFVFSEIFTQFIPADIPGLNAEPIVVALVGMVIATVFEFSLRIASSTIDDMLSGFMREVLVSPVSRFSVAMGQFLSSAIIATLQGFVVLLVGVIIGFRVQSIWTVFAVLGAMVFVGFVFAGFGLFVATRTKSIQTFQILSMAIQMPMLFLSGAYFPLNSLPSTLRIITLLNPLTYAVAFFRAVSLELMGAPTELMLAPGINVALEIGNFVVTPWISALFLFGFGALFLFLSTFAFMRTDFSKMSRNAGDDLSGEM